MKTNMIRTATLILAVFTVTSVSAQNVKSFNENSIANKLGKLVKENINNINNELKNLKDAIQFKPEADYNYSGEMAETNVLDLSGLESAARYFPSALNETNQSAEMTNELTVVLDELKGTVKYQPKADESDYMLKEISRELAEVVRFTPASCNI